MGWTGLHAGATLSSGRCSHSVPIQRGRDKPVHMKTPLRILACAVVLASSGGAAALASPAPQAALFAQLAPDRAREDVREGRRLSLGEIYQRLRARFGGDAVDVLEDRGDVYVIRWKTRDGQVRDVAVDARSGQVLR